MRIFYRIWTMETRECGYLLVQPGRGNYNSYMNQP